MEIAYFVEFGHSSEKENKLIYNFTDSEPRNSKFDMPSTRAEILAALDGLDVRLAEITDEIENLSEDGKRLFDQLERLREEVLSLRTHC